MNFLPLIIKILFVSIILTSCKNVDQEKSVNNEELTCYSNISADSSLRSASRIIGLLYHRFDEREYPSTSISRGLFEKHLRILQEREIEVISIRETVWKLKDLSDSGRYVIITVDDAFRSFYDTGYPLLKKYGMKATLFINTETVGSGEYLDWNNLKEIQEYGIEIGNHTHSHDYFLDIHDSVRSGSFKADVLKAQQLIQKNLGNEPEIFAYPYGEYDSSMQNVIKELGFITAFAQNSGVIPKYSSLYALPRFPMTDYYGEIKGFKEKIMVNPLPVKRTVPQTTISKDNPPVLTLYLDDNNLDIRRRQCFIQGSECVVVDTDPDNYVIKLKARDRLPDRRHLYTLTIPSSISGKWYWYSHQWIFPDQ